MEFAFKYIKSGRSESCVLIYVYFNDDLPFSLVQCTVLGN